MAVTTNIALLTKFGTSHGTTLRLVLQAVWQRYPRVGHARQCHMTTFARVAATQLHATRVRRRGRYLAQRACRANASLCDMFRLARSTAPADHTKDSMRTNEANWEECHAKHHWCFSVSRGIGLSHAGLHYRGSFTLAI